MTTILGIKLTERLKNAKIVQEILTKYGCNIKIRIGLHDNSCGICSPFGIILLEIFGNEEEIFSMLQELKIINGVNIQLMEL